MQAQQQSQTKREQVIDYLRSHIDGVDFLSSRDVTDEVDLTPKEIGSVLSQISEAERSDIHVEAWSYTNSTTWRIEA